MLVLPLLLLVACERQNIDITPGILYNVTTTEGDGLAVFEHAQNNKWHGVYYLDKGRLMAEAQRVDLEVGSELSLIDSRGQAIPIICYSSYEEPEFIDYPKTWAYNDSIYAVSVIKDVVYGKTRGYWVSYPDSGGTYLDIYVAKLGELKNGEKDLELTLDLYIPNDSESASRPLLVLIHGGAFFNGDKADDGFPEWSKYFSGLGYVVASVNYRLGWNPQSIEKAGYRAVQDVDASIRYLIGKKDEYAIDPERVFVAGTSAGAITALNVAFMTNQEIYSGVEKDSIAVIHPETQKPYRILAVGNMWGAVKDKSILNNAASAVISFHNMGDPVVPFGKGHPFKKSFSFLTRWFFPTMYGSGEITEYLGQQRAPLIPYDLSSEHDLHIDKDETGKYKLNARFYEIETKMRDFFSSVMQPFPVIYEHITGSQTFQISSPEIDSAYWFIEGGAILKQTDYRVNVLLFPDAPYHSVVVCGKYKSGLTFRHKWNL